MKKIIFLSLFFPLFGFSQNVGFCLFTGAKYVKSGIYFDEIEFELKEDTWTSNRLPINTDFEIKLIKPRGFSVTDGNCFPGISVLILRSNKDTLGYSANIFSDTEGMDSYMLSNLSLSLRFNEQVKVGDTLEVTSVFFDTKAKQHQAKLVFPVIISNSKLPLENTQSVYASSSTNSYETKSNFDIGKITNSTDTIQNEIFKTVKVEELELKIAEFKKGTEMIRLFDQYMNEITNNDVIESLQIDIQKNEAPIVVKSDVDIDKETTPKSNLKISLPASTKNTSKKYYLHYRWESPDKSKVFEIINPFNL